MSVSSQLLKKKDWINKIIKESSEKRISRKLINKFFISLNRSYRRLRCNFFRKGKLQILFMLRESSDDEGKYCLLNKIDLVGFFLN